MKTAKLFLKFLTVAFIITVLTTPAFAAATTDSKKTTLLVSAAASTVDAMNEIIKKFEESNPNIDVKANYGSSGALQKQIFYGGKADIFISAGKEDMDTLDKKGFLTANSRFNLLGNDLVLIVPKKPSNNVKIENFKSFLDPRVKMIAIGDSASVPAGRYAMDAATYYKVDYSLNSKANKCKDVRQVLKYVETANVDAGIVYFTDAKSSDKVNIVFTCPDASHDPIVYPAAAIKRGENPKGATAFITYLKSDTAKDIFKKNGFKTF